MSIRLIFGPMGSSKTTTLILAIRRYIQEGKRVVIIKHAGDTRYSVNNVCSHDDIKHEAIACKYLYELDNLLNEYDVIGIDEGQFFPDI